MKAIISLGLDQSSYQEVSDLILPGPEWVKLKVRAVGLCGSDIQKLINRWPDNGYMKTSVLGHEISGEVIKTGENVSEFSVGDRVAVEPLIPCYQCHYCLKGQYQLCTNLQCIGLVRFACEDVGLADNRVRSSFNGFVSEQYPIRTLKLWPTKKSKLETEDSLVASSGQDEEYRNESDPSIDYEPNEEDPEARWDKILCDRLKASERTE